MIRTAWPGGLVAIGQGLIHILTSYKWLMDRRTWGRLWLWPMGPADRVLSIAPINKQIKCISPDFGRYTKVYNLAGYVLSRP